MSYISRSKLDEMNNRLKQVKIKIEKVKSDENISHHSIEEIVQAMQEVGQIQVILNDVLANLGGK